MDLFEITVKFEMAEMATLFFNKGLSVALCVRVCVRACMCVCVLKASLPLMYIHSFLGSWSSAVLHL